MTTNLTRCHVCQRADLGDIDAALLRFGEPGGETLRALARRLELSKSALSRHKNGCLGTAGQRDATRRGGAIEQDQGKGASGRAERASGGPGRKASPGGAQEAQAAASTSTRPRGNPHPEGDPSGAAPGAYGGTTEATDRDCPGEYEEPELSNSPTATRARATPLRPPIEILQSFEDRVGAIADLIACGRWDERSSARRLAEAWDVKIGTVFDYARSAALLAKNDRGSIDTARELSIGSWVRLHEVAMAAGDLKTAANALTGRDRASGVVASGGAQVQVHVENDRILHDAQVVAVMRTMAASLDASVEDGVSAAVARARMYAALRAKLAKAIAPDEETIARGGLGRGPTPELDAPQSESDTYDSRSDPTPATQGTPP